MARPYKQGVDYYPEYTNEFEKDNYLLDVADEFGPLGEAVLFRIRNWVFAEGYYLEIDIDTLAKKLRRSIGTAWIPKVQKIKDIIFFLKDIGFIDDNLLDQGIITSVDFQKQYCFLVERRKNINTEKYWLLDYRPSLNSTDVVVNVDNNYINDSNNKVNDSNNKQIKLNQINDKSDKLDKDISINFLVKVLINNRLIEADDIDIMEYDHFIKTKINEGYSSNELARVVKYVVKQMLTKNDIDNKLAYFVKSVNSGLNNINKKKVSMDDLIKDSMKKLSNRS